ncbi:hypothetical protein GGR56DRAFT_432458 [Xylariaceae sp. FL0804]|nr:hypothetical protein GGR56DRAFT_432458 [Xylariaceae sp. FL0804]
MGGRGSLRVAVSRLAWICLDRATPAGADPRWAWKTLLNTKDLTPGSSLVLLRQKTQHTTAAGVFPPLGDCLCAGQVLSSRVFLDLASPRALDSSSRAAAAQPGWHADARGFPTLST